MMAVAPQRFLHHTMTQVMSVQRLGSLHLLGVKWAVVLNPHKSHSVSQITLAGSAPDAWVRADDLGRYLYDAITGDATARYAVPKVMIFLCLSAHAPQLLTPLALRLHEAVSWRQEPPCPWFTGRAITASVVE